jgi:hypothetical protein
MLNWVFFPKMNVKRAPASIISAPRCGSRKAGDLIRFQQQYRLRMEINPRSEMKKGDRKIKELSAPVQGMAPARRNSTVTPKIIMTKPKGFHLQIK